SAPNVNLGRGIAHLLREKAFDAARFHAGMLGHHLSCQLPKALIALAVVGVLCEGEAPSEPWLEVRGPRGWQAPPGPAALAARSPEAWIVQVEGAGIPAARRSARPVDTKADQIVQRVGVAIALEDRQPIAGDGPIMPGPLEGRFDRTVLLHQADRPLEIALLD